MPQFTFHFCHILPFLPLPAPLPASSNRRYLYLPLWIPHVSTHLNQFAFHWIWSVGLRGIVLHWPQWSVLSRYRLCGTFEWNCSCWSGLFCSLINSQRTHIRPDTHTHTHTEVVAESAKQELIKCVLYIPANKSAVTISRTGLHTRIFKYLILNNAVTIQCLQLTFDRKEPMTRCACSIV